MPSETCKTKRTYKQKSQIQEAREVWHCNAYEAVPDSERISDVTVQPEVMWKEGR